MVSTKKRRRKGKVNRKLAAQESQERLVKILLGSARSDVYLMESSVRHIAKLSRRHRLAVPQTVRHLYCRNCLQPFRHGVNVRTRIHAGQRVVTCLSCKSVRRFGGGPKFHRKPR